MTDSHMMNDTQRLREISRLQAELQAAEADAAEKLAAIKRQINELCGISCSTQARKKKAMSNADFLALAKSAAGRGRRERVT